MSGDARRRACDWLPGRLSAEAKYELARSVGEECIQEAELRNLLEKKPNPIAYDGFEPSGRMHIAQVCAVGALLEPAALQ